MTHAPDHGAPTDWAAFAPGDAGISTYDPSGKPLTKKEANLWWIVIVLAIGLIGFAVLWLPSLLR